MKDVYLVNIQYMISLVFNSCYIFPLFVNHSMKRMSLLYAMSLLIIESVNYFGKKTTQVGKCIISVSTKFSESQYKTFLKTRIFNYNRFPSFH